MNRDAGRRRAGRHACGRRRTRPRDLDAAAVRDRPDAGRLGRVDGPGRPARACTAAPRPSCCWASRSQVLEERDDWSRVVAPWQPLLARTSAATRAGCAPRHLGTPVPGRGQPRTVVAPHRASCSWTASGSSCRSAPRCGCAVTRRSVDPAPARRPARQVALEPSCGRLRQARSGHPTAPTTCSRRPAPVPRRCATSGAAPAPGAWTAPGWCTWRCAVFGVLLPRDAHDQAAAHRVEPVPLDEVQPGDLYFFARPGERIYHVGFVTRPVAADGTRWMLHAPEGGELIEDAPLAPHRLEHPGLGRPGAR